MGPAACVPVRCNAKGGVREFRGATIVVEPELHMDERQIRDRAPCPIMLNPI